MAHGTISGMCSETGTHAAFMRVCTQEAAWCSRGGCYSPCIVTTKRRPLAASRCSHSHTPCQVPRASRPPRMGIVSDAPNKLLLQCAGMSSGPSSVCTQGALRPCSVCQVSGCFIVPGVGVFHCAHMCFFVSVPWAQTDSRSRYESKQQEIMARRGGGWWSVTESAGLSGRAGLGVRGLGTPRAPRRSGTSPCRHAHPGRRSAGTEQEQRGVGSCVCNLGGGGGGRGEGTPLPMHAVQIMNELSW